MMCCLLSDVAVDVLFVSDCCVYVSVVRLLLLVDDGWRLCVSVLLVFGWL